jgi:hypothetical protein
VSLWVAVGLIGLLRRPSIVAGVLQSLAAVLVVAWWVDWFRRRSPYYVVLTDKHLIYRAAGRERLRVKLREVWCAEYSSLSREIVLRNKEGQRIAAVPDLGAPDYSLTGSLCSAINQRVGSWNGASQ